ncbi:MAG TPA: RHS repeat-associated core domain-containing protein [Acidisarcina sp.]
MDEQTVAINGLYPANQIRNLYFNGKLAYRMGFTESVYPSLLIVPDQIGSSRATVGLTGGSACPTTGNICLTNFYPFGAYMTPPATNLEQEFTGKIRDVETGNDYFGARYYSSSTGRFMSPDWSAKEEPVPYSQMDDPQSLNLYGYVKNNPLRKVDPDGHGEFSDFVSGLESAFNNDITVGIDPRNVPQTAAGGYGANLGDGLAAAGGMIETAFGSSVATGGAAACATGVGCIAGAPAVVAGGLTAAHGFGTTGTALHNMFKGGGRSANDVKKDPDAKGAHSVPKKDSEGKTTGYTTFNDKGGAVKRVDVTGGAHGGVDTPHVHEPKPGKGEGAPLRDIRPARTDELPQ